MSYRAIRQHLDILRIFGRSLRVQFSSAGDTVLWKSNFYNSFGFASCRTLTRNLVYDIPSNATVSMARLSTYSSGHLFPTKVDDP